MQYRKFKADKIFDGHRFIEGKVLVTDSEGRVVELVAEKEAGEEIQVFAGILSPGFVNCHCHLELSHMKDRIPEATGLVEFVFKVVTERHHDESEILEAIRRADEEMWRSGIVAVGDICNNTLTIPQKKSSRIAYYNFIEASGWHPEVSAPRFERTSEIAKQFSVGNLPFSIVPHAPYSVSNELWHLIQPHFQNKIVTIHNQETQFENELFLSGTGDFNRMFKMMKIDNSHFSPTRKSSLQSYFNKLQIAANIILVHNTFTGKEDIDLIQLQTPNPKPQTYFCLCPNANYYIERSVPPVELFMKSHCDIVLGTDSLASNRSLSILREIKALRTHFPEVALEEMLSWATVNGARALQMDRFLGSFEKDRQPGIIHIDENVVESRRIL